MTKIETAAILAIIVKAWPNSRIEENDDTVVLWSEMLGDLSAREVTLAVKGMAATLKFPPSIADVRETIVKQRMMAKGEPTPGEAWAMVIKAARRYGYYQPEKAREALGEKLWQALKLIGGWTQLCTDDNVDVLSAQFERRYKAMIDQEQYAQQIPAAITCEYRALLAGTQMLLEG